jgi:hypothetical protein
MKFSLPRPIYSEALSELIAKIVDEQPWDIPILSKAKLKELEKSTKEITSFGVPKRFIKKKLPSSLGHGIFLSPNAAPIEAGELIASYAGVLSIVPQNLADDGDYAFAPVSDFHLLKQEQAIWDPSRPYRKNRLYSLKLDARKQGNFTRFINHSSHPNLFSQVVLIRPNRFGVLAAPAEILYMAKKTIQPGEQLLISYEDGEKSYWGSIRPFSMTPRTFRIDWAKKLYLAKQSKGGLKDFSPPALR